MAVRFVTIEREQAEYERKEIVPAVERRQQLPEGLGQAEELLADTGVATQRTDDKDKHDGMSFDRNRLSAGNWRTCLSGIRRCSAPSDSVLARPRVAGGKLSASRPLRGALLTC
jgi:hypothetical protein